METISCENRAGLYRVAIREPGCHAGVAAVELIVDRGGYTDVLKLCDPCAQLTEEDAALSGRTATRRAL